MFEGTSTLSFTGVRRKTRLMSTTQCLRMLQTLLSNCTTTTRSVWRIVLRPQILAASRTRLRQCEQGPIYLGDSCQPRSKSITLKERLSAYWKCVYMAPDRSKKERAAHSKLVTKLKQKISEDSSKSPVLNHTPVGKLKIVLFVF